jgi:hypothetical protein
MVATPSRGLRLKTGDRPGMGIADCGHGHVGRGVEGAETSRRIRRRHVVPAIRACRQLAGFGRRTPPARCVVVPVSLECHSWTSIVTL